MTKNPPKAAQAVAAAAIAGAVEAVMLDPSSIAPSPTNPRKSFPEASLLELADSIKRDGQIQAVVVRPISVDAGVKFNKENPGHEGGPPPYEIVVGERRWRACKLAGLQIRAEIRPLSDMETVRIQIIENLHREEVHPLEEAEGYEYLLHHSAENITIDQVADEVGKSKSYVYQRMKLAALCHDARKEFLAGAFDASTALLIARLPSEALQLKAIEEIKDLGDGDETPSYRQIRAMLRDRFQLRLADAPFDIKDANLVPGSGACGACPKRSGNQPMLFQDVDSPDVCTDPDCFASKREATVQRSIATARKKGIKVIEGDEAKEVMPYNGCYMHQFTPLDDSVHAPDGEETTIRELLEKQGKKAPKPTILVNPHDGGLIEIIERDTASKLKNAFWEQHSRKTKNEKETPEEIALREEREAEELQSRIDREARALIIDALTAKADQPRTHEDMVVIVMSLIGDELDDDVFAAVGLDAPAEEADVGQVEAAMVAGLQACAPARLAALAMELALGKHTSYYRGDIPTPALQAAAESHGINLAKLRKKAEKQALSEEEAE